MIRTKQKWKKQASCVVLCVGLILSCLSISSSAAAEDELLVLDTYAVAEMNGVGYDSLAAAIEAANISGGVITMLDNWDSEGDRLNITGTVVLDLTGREIITDLLIMGGSLTLLDSDSGGTIMGTIAVEQSGNAYETEESGGIFIMNGGTITGICDYGVRVENGSFIMNDGSVTGGSAGGVYIGENGSFTVGGTPSVAGNTKDGVAHNVYLSGGKSITANGSFFGSLGVTTADAPASAQPVAVANGFDLSGISSISADVSAYEVSSFNGTAFLMLSGDLDMDGYSHENSQRGISDTEEEAQVASVEITWGAMSFTYTNGLWNTETLTYDEGIWTAEDNTVTVENTGTVAVTAAVEYKNGPGFNFTSAWDQQATEIPVETSASFTLTLFGKPETGLDGEPIGTVTVTIQ